HGGGLAQQSLGVPAEGFRLGDVGDDRVPPAEAVHPAELLVGENPAQQLFGVVLVQLPDGEHVGIGDRRPGRGLALFVLDHLVHGALGTVAGDDLREQTDRAGMLVGAMFEVPVGQLVVGGVDNVGVLAAGERDVQRLAIHVRPGEHVAASHCHALRAVHGGRVPELHVVGDVVGGDGDLAAADVVAQPQRSVVADLGDGPQVAVLHPARGVAVGVLDDVLGVVLPGDHHIPDSGFETVGQDDAGSGDGAACAVVGGGL